jgi:hypothetical protein
MTTELQGALVEAIFNYHTASILDRANQTGGVIVCDWETYR